MLVRARQPVRDTGVANPTPTNPTQEQQKRKPQGALKTRRGVMGKTQKQGTRGSGNGADRQLPTFTLQDRREAKGT